MIHDFLASQIFLLALTVGSYVLGVAVYRRTRVALLHPVLLSVVALVAILYGAGIEYEAYAEATGIFSLLLNLSVVALGYLLWEHVDRLRAHALSILTSVVVGSIVGVGSVVGIVCLMGADEVIAISLAPKSVTAPIAVAVVEPLGGIKAITSVVVICVGIFGSIVAPKILDFIGVRDPVARGLAMGSAAHGIGTARAIEIGAVEGAVSGLAMGLMGGITAIIVPLFPFS
ncbi:MAG: LrgB family protein [Alistipes sp.]|nr:LrgB family protein [Alistipes sp.]